MLSWTKIVKIFPAVVKQSGGKCPIIRRALPTYTSLVVERKWWMLRVKEEEVSDKELLASIKSDAWKQWFKKGERRRCRCTFAKFKVQSQTSFLG